MLVLERATLRPDARRYAVLAGAAVTSDAHHITAGHPDGQTRAVRRALADAGLPPEAVGLVHAHATSTPKGDLTEAETLGRVFGPHRPAVTATKSMTGHLFGAAGALAALATAYALHHQYAPAVRNLTTPDPGLPLRLLTTPGPLPHTAALTNAFGFGGHNASLVLTAP